MVYRFRLEIRKMIRNNKGHIQNFIYRPPQSYYGVTVGPRILCICVQKIHRIIQNPLFESIKVSKPKHYAIIARNHTNFTVKSNIFGPKSYLIILHIPSKIELFEFALLIRGPILE